MPTLLNRGQIDHPEQHDTRRYDVRQAAITLLPAYNACMECTDKVWVNELGLNGVQYKAGTRDSDHESTLRGELQTYPELNLLCKLYARDTTRSMEETVYRIKEIEISEILKN